MREHTRAPKKQPPVARNGHENEIVASLSSLGRDEVDATGGKTSRVHLAADVPPCQQTLRCQWCRGCRKRSSGNNFKRLLDRVPHFQTTLRNLWWDQHGFCVWPLASCLVNRCLASLCLSRVRLLLRLWTLFSYCYSFFSLWGLSIRFLPIASLLSLFSLASLLLSLVIHFFASRFSFGHLIFKSHF